MSEQTYLILGSVCALTTEAIKLSARASANEAITLQCLVILNVLLELAEGVCPGRALRATEE